VPELCATDRFSSIRIQAKKPIFFIKIMKISNLVKTYSGEKFGAPVAEPGQVGTSASALVVKPHPQVRQAGKPRHPLRPLDDPETVRKIGPTQELQLVL
jgi:hypothetical protein